MEPTDTLNKQFEDILNELRTRYSRARTDKERNQYMTLLKNAHRDYTKLVNKFNEQRLQHQARLQALIMSLQSDVPPKPLDSWSLFVKERTRKPPAGVTQQTTIKEILKAYNRWIVMSGAKKIDIKELEGLCDTTFTKVTSYKGDIGVYDIFVFLDDEDLEEYDTNHQ